jgi:hypothetical protein
VIPNQLLRAGIAADTPIYTGGGCDVARGVYPLGFGVERGGIEARGILANDD